MNFFLLYVSYSILRLNNWKYFVLQQKLVLVNSVALVITLSESDHRHHEKGDGWVVTHTYIHTVRAVPRVLLVGGGPAGANINLQNIFVKFLIRESFYFKNFWLAFHIWKIIFKHLANFKQFEMYNFKQLRNFLNNLSKTYTSIWKALRKFRKILSKCFRYFKQFNKK